MGKVSMSPQNLKINLLLLGLSCVISFLGGEAALRALGYYGVRTGKMSGTRVVDDAMVNYRMIPNNSWILNNIRFRTNAHGWRDTDHAYPKPANTYRIVVLGDSITFGYGVNLAETYPKQLEQQLNQQPSLPTRYEVISIAMGGLGTEQEAYLLEREGLKYDPDLVIVGYCSNDPVPGDLIAAQRTSQSRPLLVRSYYRVKEFAARSSFIHYLYKSAQKISWQIGVLVGREEIDAEVRDDVYSRTHADPQSWGSVMRGFEKFRQLSAQHQLPVMLVIFPLLHHLQDYPWSALHQQIAAAASQNKITVIDLLPRYRQYPQSKLQVDNGDPLHPNAFGHRLASVTLYEWLTQNGNNPYSIRRGL